MKFWHTFSTQMQHVKHFAISDTQCRASNGKQCDACSSPGTQICLLQSCGTLFIFVRINMYKPNVATTIKTVITFEIVIAQ